MFAFFRSLIAIVAPIFVVSTMLNVGLTQSLSAILAHLKNYPFVLKMLLANFILAPLFMIFTLMFTNFDSALRDGLLIFSLCAGAPFLIKLTKTADHSIALGAAVMILLIAGTVIYVPIVLPLVLYGASVDAWAIAWSLFLQMLLPIAAGMLAVQLVPDLTKRAQPWVAWLGNISLYVLIAVTLIGYLPNLVGIIKTGVIYLGLGFVLVAFVIGYLMGGGKDHLEDVGGLGTAQRNIAAGLIIAIQNESDPNVLVTLTLANTFGIVALLFIARKLSQDDPTAAPAV
jgi:bile acid:Na+ symporter, BASS family